MFAFTPPDISLDLLILILVTCALFAYVLRHNRVRKYLKAVLPDEYFLMAKVKLGEVLEFSPEALEQLSAQELERLRAYRADYLICDSNRPLLIIAIETRKFWPPGQPKMQDQDLDRLLRVAVAERVSLPGRVLGNKAELQKRVSEKLKPPRL